MHAGLNFLVSLGSLQPASTRGAENLAEPVGAAANGIPKNLLTKTVALGILVVVPMSTPLSMVAVGIALRKSQTGP
jgi:hypothetical protein